MNCKAAYISAVGIGSKRHCVQERRAHWLGCALTACAAFLLPFGMRALEIPLWDNPAYKLNGEYLLATQDAYHWIAGAEGFEFGVGHPMSELIRFLSWALGMLPANVGFWLPLFLGSLLSVGVFAWGAALGFPCAGMIAGVMAALSPGFLARTLLGFCDTDLVILLFGLLLGFVPMLWLRPWLSSPAAWAMAVVAAFGEARKQPAASIVRGAFAVLLAGWRAVPSARRIVALRSLSPLWLTALVLAGVWGYYTQSWHSFFPYAVRFSALVLPLLIVLFGPRGGKRLLLAGALCHLAPLLLGPAGAAVGALLAFVLSVFSRPAIATGLSAQGPSAWLRRRLAPCARYAAHMLDTRTLALLWLALGVYLLDVAVWGALVRSVGSYLKTSGELAADARGAADPLVYPAVSQSISEIQNLQFYDFLTYFHPAALFALLGLIGYCCLLFVFPELVYLAMMLAVALSSLTLGGRMAMFGSPVLALGFTVGVACALKGLFALLPFARPVLLQRLLQFDKTYAPLRWLFSLCLAFSLVWPMAGMLPSISKGPIISQDHARALTLIRGFSPEDSVVWNWWDWGYAVHHFSRRKTVCDGARHGGPSLFVPAAVYTTDDPFFARQLMAYTSEMGEEPGNIFEGLGASGAADLMSNLDSGKIATTPKSKQYIVVCFDLVPLGFWISSYGTWDFLRKEGKGYFITSIPQALQYSLDTGVVLIRGQEPAYASSIDVFMAEELKRQSYYRGTDARFVFNTVSNDKLLMKNDLYNSLMYQLLVATPDDARITPYFRLVYDSAQVRVYEML